MKQMGRDLWCSRVYRVRYLTAAATFPGESSCTKCPTSGMTSSWYFPCIWPIISSLSSLSVPARMSSLPPAASRNFLLRPTNQLCQKGCVAARSVRQRQGRAEPSAASTRSAGTETEVEAGLRMVRERRCHSMPDESDAKAEGRVERYVCMLCSASMAEPELGQKKRGSEGERGKVGGGG